MSVDARTYTGEQKRLEEAVARARTAKTEADERVRTAQREAQRAGAALKQAVAALEAHDEARPGIQVTDHAVVRYLERVGQMDMDAVRKHILPGGAEAALMALPGAKSYRVAAGHRLILRGRSVVTVTTDGTEAD